MSIGGILSAARSGMNAQQLAVQIAAHNIANAQTEGYSTQRVNMAAAYPTTYPYGSVSAGVTVQSITRARDTLLDVTYRNDSAAKSGADAKATALGQIEGVFGEPSTTGLSAALDAFWNSWNDLANDPTNDAAKGVVRNTGANITTMLNRMAKDIDRVDQTNREGMNNDVNTINSLATKISEINVHILSAESSGNSANDLRDARDVLLDQITALTGGQVVERANGTVAVYVSGRMLVDAATVKPLQMNNGQPPTVKYANSALPLDGMGGSLGAKIDVAINGIPNVMASLDALAKGLVQGVNAIHSSGLTFSGTPPVSAAAGNFFQVTAAAPPGTDVFLTARAISLAAGLTNAKIAASGGTATGPGNNDVAFALSALRDNTLNFTTPTGAAIITTKASSFYETLVGSVASSTKQATDDVEVQTTLVANSTARRQSIFGVATDEELMNVITHQHAYQAAARLVSVVDEMTKTLVDLGR